MSTLGDIICKNDVEKLQNQRKNALNKLIAKLLIENLIRRLNHNNLLYQTKGHRLTKIKLDKRGLYLWARPFVQNNRLMLEIESPNWFFKQAKIEAADIFGDGINKVNLPRY